LLRAGDPRHGDTFAGGGEARGLNGIAFSNPGDGGVSWDCRFLFQAHVVVNDGRRRCMHYYNSQGERVSRRRFREMYNAFKNRQELIKAGLMNRRSLIKMGLLTSAGYLV